MGDPLSTTASIIATIQLSEKVSKYLCDVKDAPEECYTLLSEVAASKALLEILERKATSAGQGYPSDAVNLLNVPNGPLHQFERELKRIESKLGPADGFAKISKRLRWPFQKREAKNILKAIERQKSLFLLALQNDLL